MNAVELALQKVKKLDEEHALRLIEWLRTFDDVTPKVSAPLGARAMLGFARRFRSESRSTADWMAELREGESPDALGD